MRTHKELKIAGNRREIRHKLIEEFLKEEPGQGTGELCSVYVYYVETLRDGNKVFLKRPARLNKGFDFEVNVENTLFGLKRKTTMPSHSSIFADLQNKQKEDAEKFDIVRRLIEKIYNCEDITEEEIGSVQFKVGYPIDTILKAIKWLFIEQDMTYWNWSGRNMLYSGLKGL
jgi:hypothetical protein